MKWNTWLKKKLTETCYLVSRRRPMVEISTMWWKMWWRFVNNFFLLLALKNSMDTFGQQLHSKLTQHLTVADQQLRDHIVKTVHKKVGVYVEIFSWVFNEQLSYRGVLDFVGRARGRGTWCFIDLRYYIPIPRLLFVRHYSLPFYAHGFSYEMYPFPSLLQFVLTGRIFIVGNSTEGPNFDSFGKVKDSESRRF